MSKKHLFLILTTVLALLAGNGCTKEYRFHLSDNPGYVENPVLSVRALDGDHWVDGEMDLENRSVTFKFRKLASLESVVLDVILDDEWAEMTSPKTTRFEANLKSGGKFTVNDGVDNIVYTVDASLFRHITGATAAFSGETIDLNSQGNFLIGSFPNAFVQSDLEDVDISLELDEDAELVTELGELEDIDFSAGAGFNVVVKDKVTGQNKTYIVYINPSDVVNLGSSWSEVTKAWQNSDNIAFGNMRMYTNEKLYGYNGNIGYLFTIPAGRVEMKVMEKNDAGTAVMNMSAAVRANRDYTLFLSLQGPGVWHTDGSTSNSGYTYYSPLAWGPNKAGLTTVLRNDGFGGSDKSYAPAMGLDEGKVSMERAGTKDGSLYSYADVTGAGESLWAPESAFGGYFMIVKDGNSLINGDDLQSYSSYTGAERKQGTDLTTFWSPSWSACVPIMNHDMLRTGRIGVGCTEKGDLVILVVEKFVNTHNQGQLSDSGHNGGASDTRGLTLFELADTMKGMGCSDVMTVEDFNWSYLLLQDGSERGKDIFWTNNRYNFGGNAPKDESAESKNLVIVCFK